MSKSTVTKTTVLIALGASVLASLAAGSTVQAAPRDALNDLPILVDRWYEIKNPSGPVEAVVVPEELQRPQILYQVPEMDLKDIPNPEFEQVLIGL